MKKKKILEILITALISAGIAFLSNLLTQLTGQNIMHTSPETAGTVGAVIASVRKFLC